MNPFMGDPTCDGSFHAIRGNAEMILSSGVDRIVGFSSVALLKHCKNDKNEI